MYIQKPSSKSPTWSSAERRTSMNAPFTASTGPASTSGARYWASRRGARWSRPITAKWPSAPAIVGNERRAAWSNVPSSRTRRHPQMPISDRSSMSCTSRCTPSDGATVSGLRARTYGAFPRRIARLFAALKPRFRSLVIASAAGSAACATSTVPSRDPLSTTRTRAYPVSTSGRSASRQAPIRSRLWNETTTTSTRTSDVPPSCGELGREDAVGGRRPRRVALPANLAGEHAADDRHQQQRDSPLVVRRIVPARRFAEDRVGREPEHDSDGGHHLSRPSLRYEPSPFEETPSSSAL